MRLPTADAIVHHRPTLRTRRQPRRVALGAAGLAALALLTTPPSVQGAVPVRGAAAVPESHETASGVTPVGDEVVTLVTGDRVLVTHLSDGRTTATILPGSPHVGDPVQVAQTPTAAYVMPRLPAAERSRLDPSMFDVTALAHRSHTHPSGTGVPVDVTFSRGVTPHDLPGLTLDRPIAHRRGNLRRHGQTVAKGHYSSSTGMAAVSPSSWRDVASISLANSAPPPPPAGIRMHTLTLHVTDNKGGPVHAVTAFVQNVDDAALFTQPVAVVHGVARISVPEGNYSVLTGDATHILMDPDFPVTVDTTEEMTFADSTVKASEAVPGFAPIEAALGIGRISERHGGFTWADLGGSFDFTANPLPPDPPHGEVTSALSGTFAPTAATKRDGGGTYEKLAYVKDGAEGIPMSLRFTHPKSDFAIVSQRLNANGPAGRRYADAVALAPFDPFIFYFTYPVSVPGVRTLWLEGSRDLTWQQGLQAISVTRRDPVLGILTRSGMYSPGPSRPVSFAHGPVGPGLDTGYDGAGTGKFCTLCRNGNLLHGDLPLFSGAGTAMAGELTGKRMGSWTLSHAVETLASGYHVLTPNVTLPPAASRYTLTADSHPHTAEWQQSTDVTDKWGFTSGSGDGVIPLLMPSYVPPTALDGTMPAGATRFILHVGNLGPADAKVTRATLELSTDGGEHWTPATLTRVDQNTFAVSYTNPGASDSKRYMSLRVTAADAGGQTVTETAVNVYKLVASHQPVTRRAQSITGKHACPPATATRAACDAIVSRTGVAALRPDGEPAGWGATDLEDAYDIPRFASDQTVAVVVANDYPTAETDLNAYRKHYGLPPCTTESGCFTKINQDGDQGNYPPPDEGWAIEASLDMEMISAACPTCHIILAEAREPLGDDLGAATMSAITAGADVTNHSYGFSERTGVRHATSPYDQPGVTAVASTGEGESGFGVASFPASTPHVIAVGGTVLHHADNARGWRENAWKHGGSACSAYFAKPSYQQDKACGMRTSADISAVSLGVAVYNSYAGGTRHPWGVVGGTSVSSPLVAGLVGQAQAGGIKPAALYGKPGSYYDITAGANGHCHRSYLCTAKPGYDAPTGWGTPRGIAPFTVG